MARVVAGFLVLCAVSLAVLGDAPLITFEDGKLPSGMVQNSTKATLIKHEGKQAMEIQFESVDWPNVFFAAPDGVWDWREYSGLAVELYNPGGEGVDVCMRVDNQGADGMSHCNNGNVAVPAGEKAVLKVMFTSGDKQRFWGMRGIPEVGPIGMTGVPIDTSRIVAFQVFLGRPLKSQLLVMTRAWLYGKGSGPASDVPMPFINEFGQYRHDHWRGKIECEKDLHKYAKKEQRALRKCRYPYDADEYGGWAGGPELTATGWFRTAKLSDGKWWLVTPTGHLFFSTGMDCVGAWEQTFVDGRDGWFEGLPDPKDPKYGHLYGNAEGAHSMADTIGGKGRTFSFYRYNLMRRYGDDWAGIWRDRSYDRLKSWGFNTLGNWCQGDVIEKSPMPFVISTGVWGAKTIQGAKGYWGRLIDVYDPGFEDAVEKSVGSAAGNYAENKRCIGFFVDNELSWETIRSGTLASPADQPCRVVFVEILKKKYGTLEALNTAWGTQAAGWDTLALLPIQNAACSEDLDDFVHTFALRYFTVIRDAIKRNAPNHLYLGCRFATAPKPAVRACAEVADVVSFNLYYRAIEPSKWTGKNDLGKPVMIGEFHFGALDRGMFHPGLVGAKDQEDRAECYAKYVRSVAECPAFVGCHWFQYVDEPTTGRWFDGENYNIGFVDITDTPYPEMVKSAKKTHRSLYEWRYNGNAGQ